MRLTVDQINVTGSASSFTGNLAGDVTGTQGATVIAANAVTNAKLATMADQTIKGNVSGGTAAPVDLTAAQVTTMIQSYVEALITYGIYY